MMIHLILLVLVTGQEKACVFSSHNFSRKAEKRCFGGSRKTLGDRHVFTYNFIKDCSEAKASGWIHVIIFQLRSLKHFK